MYNFKHYKIFSIFMFKTRMWGVHVYRGEDFLETYSAESFNHAWQIVDNLLRGNQ